MRPEFRVRIHATPAPRLRDALHTTATLAAALVLSACQPRPATEHVPTSAFPVDVYTRLANDGEAVFRLVPEASRIDVVVRREGPLARFGHDHVVVIDRLEGLAAESARSARADIRFALDEVVVDRADARARHGLSTEPSAGDIEGTRRNMLDATLRAKTWPEVYVAARLATPLDEATRAELDIALHGRRHGLAVPLHVERRPREATIHARFELRQTDFAIQPYSALGGGLRVADTLELHATLHFVVIEGGPGTGSATRQNGMQGGRSTE